ncbi:MAG: acetyl-CoA carboxylase biotin carboxyl carrier protein [Halanaerobiales bacterium]
MDIDKVKRVIDFLDGTNISELEIENEDLYLKIKRGYVQEGVQPQRINHVLNTPVTRPVQSSEQTIVVEEKEVELDENIKEIVSPMVGTFYRSSSPEAEPFVNEGDTIVPGNSLCIVEAMKLMNEIEAEERGEIVKILVEDGQAVDYGQALFRIKVS